MFEIFFFNSFKISYSGSAEMELLLILTELMLLPGQLESFSAYAFLVPA